MICIDCSTLLQPQSFTAFKLRWPHNGATVRKATQSPSGVNPWLRITIISLNIQLQGGDCGEDPAMTSHGGSTKVDIHGLVGLKDEENIPSPVKSLPLVGSPVETPDYLPFPNPIVGLATPPTSFLDTQPKLREQEDAHRKTPLSDRGCPLGSLQDKAQLQSEYLRGLVVAPAQCCWEGDEFDYSFLKPLPQLSHETYNFSTAPAQDMGFIDSLPAPDFRSPMPSSSDPCPPSPCLDGPPLALLPPTLDDRLQYSPFRYPHEFELLIDNSGLPERITVDDGYWQRRTRQLLYPYPSNMSICWITFVDNDRITPSPGPDFWDMVESSWVDQGMLPWPGSITQTVCSLFYTLISISSEILGFVHC